MICALRTPQPRHCRDSCVYRPSYHLTTRKAATELAALPPSYMHDTEAITTTEPAALPPSYMHDKEAITTTELAALPPSYMHDTEAITTTELAALPPSRPPSLLMNYALTPFNPPPARTSHNGPMATIPYIRHDLIPPGRTVSREEVSFACEVGDS